VPDNTFGSTLFRQKVSKRKNYLRFIPGSQKSNYQLLNIVREKVPNVNVAGL
jgi:hypothetical protein